MSMTTDALKQPGVGGQPSAGDELEARIRAIVAKQLEGVEEDKITLDASFVDDLGAGSLETVELIMELEEAFCIEILDEDARKIRTLQDAVDHIRRALQEKAE